MALRKKDHMLSRCLVKWAGSSMFQLSNEQSVYYLTDCLILGDVEDFWDLVNQGLDFDKPGIEDATALHYAAFYKNLDVVIAIIEKKPALISALEIHDKLALTPLEFATWSGSPDIVGYLLDHGAKSISHNALYFAKTFFGSDETVRKGELLLDHGWDRTIKNSEGKTLLDVACSKYNTVLVNHLENYQTVRLPPYGMASHIVDEKALKSSSSVFSSDSS
ncbi:hypothetical protein C0993_006641 [Termitomyces sp. T159_Od127]|nr:hypothetical protein C0993_006641 [Termitomyces sp. T159_Od127]